MDTNKEIGKRIKEVRNNKNISQVDLAKQIGVAKSTLAGYESGYRAPNYEILKK